MPTHYNEPNDLEEAKLFLANLEALLIKTLKELNKKEQE
jgi:hypothetical protein